MPPDLSMFCIAPEDTIQDAIELINNNAKGIALVTDDRHRLIGTITDGDIRRVILAGRTLNMPVRELLAQKASSPYPKPVTAPVGTNCSELREIMLSETVRQVPLLYADGSLADLVTLDELVPEHAPPLKAVIMAGGLGARLRPLTENLPKPMLPVGDRPLLELIVEQLRQSGVQEVSVAMHFLPESIIEHFGDGRDFGVQLSYVTEALPLGTAGALGLLPAPSETMLVINGDILTHVDFGAMLAYHRDHRADMTVAVRHYEFQVPYGVVESDGSHVRRLAEKPSYSFFINAGIYLLEPSVFAYIPHGESYNMTDLIQRLLDAGKPVESFPIHEYWLDIGRHADYLLAQEVHGRPESVA